MNLQPKDKEMFRNKSANTISKDIHHLTKAYLEFCLSHSSEQLIARPTRVNDQTATLDHIFTNTWLSQSIRSSRSWSIYPDLIYSTRKTSLPTSHNHDEIFVCLMNKYSTENFLQNLRVIVFANYMT